jgi:hypothetical protein|eukprot:COSAG06_NODE_3139_length_5799_cov_50.068772_2_plen_65_part_00
MTTVAVRGKKRLFLACDGAVFLCLKEQRSFAKTGSGQMKGNAVSKSSGVSVSAQAWRHPTSSHR